MKYKPVIVIVGFNRPESLRRILHSLDGIKDVSDAKLVISIDHNAPDNYEVRDIAIDFKWPFGEKEVIYQQKRMGLKKHILNCAELSQSYGSVIILEDDLFVSPFFYDYAIQALEFYEKDKKIGGISLFNQTVEEITQLPFTPIADNSDVYFMQFPSSWGQAWTRDQWKEFKEWYDSNPDITSIPIPRFVKNWPESSWKKYFCAYLVDTDKFFVFPRISFTTNFNDPGTHLKELVDHEGQTQLRIINGPYRFAKLSESYARYDVYHELHQETVKKIIPHLNDYSFEFDLYGNKEMKYVKTPYVITRKYATAYERSYKRALKPHEMNIVFNLEGNDLFLCKKEKIQSNRKNSEERLSEFEYYYTCYLPGYKFLFYKYFRRYRLIRSIFK